MMNDATKNAVCALCSAKTFCSLSFYSERWLRNVDHGNSITAQQTTRNHTKQAFCTGHDINLIKSLSVRVLFFVL